MSHKISNKEASKKMLEKKLKPLEEYPGRANPWRCKCLDCGYIVTPRFSSIQSGQGGCRYCAGKMPISESSAREFFRKANLKPISPFPGVGIGWKSKCLTCGKISTPRLDSVKNRGAKCRFCSAKERGLKGRLTQAQAFKIAKQANLKPLEPYTTSQNKWKCLCLKCELIVYPMVTSLQRGQGGCKKCGYAENKRKQLTPADEAIAFFKSKGFTPLTQYPGANRPWKSKCTKCGEITEPHYNSIKSGGGCGVCAGRIVPLVRAVNDMKAANLEPLEPYPGGKTKWKCKCLKCGEIVYPKYGDIKQGDGGCKYCGGHYVDPDIVFKTMVAKGANPQSPYKSSGAKWHCICQICKRDIYPNWDSVRGGGAPCAYCARRRIVPKEAEQKMKIAGAKPLVKYPGAKSPWECRCLKCKRIIFPYYGSVINEGQSACPYCAGKKVDPESAFILMVNAGLNPLVKYISASAPWPCICEKCGKKVSPTYSSIRIGQGGCRYCTNKGLDYNSTAFLYLMTHQEFRAHKIGVGNHKTRNNRIKEHIKTGWILIENQDFQTGDDAFQVEQETLVWLREVKKLGIYLSKSEMPQGGETETVDASEIDLPTIWAKVEELSRVKR
jgi:hypothetical protein